MAPWYRKMQDFRFTGGDVAKVHFDKLYFETVYQQSDGTPVGKLETLFGFLQQNLPIHSFGLAVSIQSLSSMKHIRWLT